MLPYTHQNRSRMHPKSLQPIAFTLALAGWLVLLWVNLALLLGKQPPIDLSFVKIFFVLFPLWAYTIYFLRETKQPLTEEALKNNNKLQLIRYYLGNPPMWAMIALAVCYGYALYSLFLFLSGGMMDPEYVNGQYQINNHGKTTIYTNSEYQAMHRLHLRAITGFFLAFFSVSTVVLAPWRGGAFENTKN